MCPTSKEFPMILTNSLYARLVHMNINKASLSREVTKTYKFGFNQWKLPKQIKDAKEETNRTEATG